MTISINSHSTPRCIAGCSLNQFGLGVTACYPWVTSSSAVPTVPLWPLPPKPSSAPRVTPLALWSRKGIGIVLVLLAYIITPRGMARIYKCHYNCYMYILYICYCYPVSVPQPCLYPILTPYSTVASVVPECEPSICT